MDHTCINGCYASFTEHKTTLIRWGWGQNKLVKLILMLTIFAVSVMSLHGVAVADDNNNNNCDNCVQNISVERSSTNVPSAVLSWDNTQEGIKQYNIKYKCSGDKKENLRVPGNQSSYTFDVNADQSCKINIRSISDSGEKSDNVKIILASGEPTGKIAEDVKKSTGEIAEDVKNFTTRSGNVPAADSTPPTFDSATLDEKTGVLAITFDEIIANEGFDLSTADYTDRSFLISKKGTTPTGMAFNPDGTKMFVVDDKRNRINEYELTTAFNLDTGSYTGYFSVSAQDRSPVGVAFSPAGTKMFVVGNDSEKIYEYTLTTAFNVSTASHTGTLDVYSKDTSPIGVAFNPAGTKMFVVGFNTVKIYEYTLSTAFNVSTASHTGTLDVYSKDNSLKDVAFNPAGTKMFVVGNQHNRVYEYALSTPFDVSSSSYTQHFSVGSQDNSPAGMAFNPAGTKMFVVGNDNEKIYEYTLTTPVDLSKLFISELGSVNGTGTALTGASIETVGNSDSIEIHLTEPQIESVIALTVPQLDIMAAAVSDVSGNEIAAAPDNAIAVTNSVSVVTITYKSQFGGDVLTAPYGIAFEPDGDILVADSVADKIFVFYNNGTLKSSFGSDGSGDGQFDSPKGVALAPNGDIFVADDGNDRIQVFNSTYNYKTQFGFADSDSTRNLTSPVNIAFEPDGDVLVVDLDSGQVFVFDPVFSFKSKFDLGQGTAPIDVARLPNGDILVADFFKHRISVFDSAYNYKTQFGSAGLDDGQLNVPRALHVTYNGDILVIEGGNDRISVFDSAYNYKFQFGSHGSSDGEFICTYQCSFGS